MPTASFVDALLYTSSKVQCILNRKLRIPKGTYNVINRLY